MHVRRLTATCTEIDQLLMEIASKDQAKTKQGPRKGKERAKQGPSKDQDYGPSKDAQEKRENFYLSVGLTVDTW